MGVMGVSEFVGYRIRLRDGIESSSNVNRFGQGGKTPHYMRHLIVCFRRLWKLIQLLGKWGSAGGW